MGDYGHAIAMASQAQEIAEQIEMKDARLELYGMLGDPYSKKGDTQRAQHYRNQYLQLKPAAAQSPHKDVVAPFPANQRAEAQGDRQRQPLPRGDPGRRHRLHDVGNLLKNDIKLQTVFFYVAFVDRT